jgi:CheY-like chemotaxis protein
MNQQRLRILICDTDVETLIGLEQMLEDAGFDTTTTWDAIDLERSCACNVFHLLIIGDHPPQMDAEAMLKQLRGKDRRGTDTPCLALKGDPCACDIERFCSSGAIAVVSRRDYSSIVKQAESCLRRCDSQVQKAG